LPAFSLEICGGGDVSIPQSPFRKWPRSSGEHLAGNADTEYKKALLHFMSEHYRLEHITPAGKLELVEKGGTTVECDLVLMTEWHNRLPGEFLKVENV
jgi:hypothetical protein